MGGGLAQLAVQAGHGVIVSNSRDPRTLFSLSAALLGRGLREDLPYLSAVRAFETAGGFRVGRISGSS